MTTFPSEYLTYLKVLEEKSVQLTETEKALLEKEKAGKNAKNPPTTTHQTRGD
jgi:hypothetical protein